MKIVPAIILSLPYLQSPLLPSPSIYIGASWAVLLTALSKLVAGKGPQQTMHCLMLEAQLTQAPLPFKSPDAIRKEMAAPSATHSINLAINRLITCVSKEYLKDALVYYIEQVLHTGSSSTPINANTQSQIIERFNQLAGPLLECVGQPGLKMAMDFYAQNSQHLQPAPQPTQKPII